MCEKVYQILIELLDKVLLKISGFFTQPFCQKKFRGTCSSVKMLKGYVVRERLGIPALNVTLLKNEEWLMCSALFAGFLSPRRCSYIENYRGTHSCCTVLGN